MSHCYFLSIFLIAISKKYYLNLVLLLFANLTYASIDPNLFFLLQKFSTTGSERTIEHIF